MSADARIAELGLELPPAPKPAGAYQPMVVVDRLVYLSGHLPLRLDGTMHTGKVGVDTDGEGGYAAARQCGLAMLATLRGGLVSLDRIGRLVKVLGVVNAAPDFEAVPAVINGFSDLMREVFGERDGVAARSAIGASSLPAGATTEVEAIFELKPSSTDT